MEFLIKSTADLDTVIPQIAEALKGRKKIALEGDMGAGKTTFVKAFCLWLGVRTETNSPTFSLVNEYVYTAPNGSEALVHHLDLYRLNGMDEVLDIGIEDYLYDPWYCFVEWPELIEAILPHDAATIRIALLENGYRNIMVDA
jgi:tRNA threonylcarbamoyladenosine biosynthesis protein TsaE